MKFICSALFLVLLLLGCNSRSKDLVLKIEKVYGLSDSTAVTLNKKEIGKVNMTMNNKYAEIIVASNNTDFPKIPIDSKLEISNSNASKKIEVEVIYGKSNIYVRFGDTLRWFKSNAEKELEKLILVGDYIFLTNKQDSLRITKVK